eukprot:3971626-Prymnesium_polylepis.2
MGDWATDLGADCSLAANCTPLTTCALWFNGISMLAAPVLLFMGCRAEKDAALIRALVKPPRETASRLRTHL